MAEFMEANALKVIRLTKKKNKCPHPRAALLPTPTLLPTRGQACFISAVARRRSTSTANSPQQIGSKIGIV